MSEKDTTPVKASEAAAVKAEDLEARPNKGKYFLPETEQVTDAKGVVAAQKQAEKDKENE